MDNLINKKSKEYERQYISHLSSQDDVEERLLANPGMFITPIVRDGKKRPLVISLMSGVGGVLGKVKI